MLVRPDRLRAVMRSRQVCLGAAVLVFLGVIPAGLSWWFTPALEQPRSLAHEARRPPSSESLGKSPTAVTWPEWPEARLDGKDAKELLLAWLEACEKSIDAIDGFTTTFRKQERIKGRLLPEQTYQLKVRHRPFALYMKCVAPASGRELIYAEGQFDNHVIGHPGGVSRLLLPRLKLPPNHPMIMAESRHPVDQAGLANLIHKMVHSRRMDLNEPEEITILDRTETPDGRKWLRSTHRHPVRRPEHHYAEAEVLYDPETHLPLRFTGYDWPAPGEKDRPLGERYCYDDLRLGVALSERDFDPANPDYSFHRF